jgi:hypothetical protein
LLSTLSSTSENRRAASVAVRRFMRSDYQSGAKVASASRLMRT